MARGCVTGPVTRTKGGASGREERGGGTEAEDPGAHELDLSPRVRMAGVKLEAPIEREIVVTLRREVEG